MFYEFSYQGVDFMSGIYNEGTTIPSLRTETLNRLEFKIPSINEQMKILSYIEPIDNIIEVNMNINKNLCTA